MVSHILTFTAKFDEFILFPLRRTSFEQLDENSRHISKIILNHFVSSLYVLVLQIRLCLPRGGGNFFLLTQIVSNLTNKVVFISAHGIVS